MITEAEIFIRNNFPAILGHPKVKALTDRNPGAWGLLNDEIDHISATPKNIAFTLFVGNQGDCLRVRGKFNRESRKLSNVEVE